MPNEEGSRQPEVTFTIDGVEFTTSRRKQKAGELLDLAGLDPVEHDLARLTGERDIEHEFGDDDIVQLTPASRFVSLFRGPTPVA